MPCVVVVFVPSIDCMFWHPSVQLAFCLQHSHLFAFFFALLHQNVALVLPGESEGGTGCCRGRQEEQEQQGMPCVVVFFPSIVCMFWHPSVQLAFCLQHSHLFAFFFALLHANVALVLPGGKGCGGRPPRTAGKGADTGG